MTRFISRGWPLAALLFASAMQAQDSVLTLAGRAQVGGGTNGPGTNALFSAPTALVADATGNLFVADSQNHVIRKIGTNGNVTTFAGQFGIPGSANGTGTQARFNSPSGIALDPGGNLFISDTGNHTLRKITAAGVVSTLAGLAGQSGVTNATGASARFNSPLGLAVATNATIYLADSGNHLIRKISSSGAVSTLAGSPENWGDNDGTSTNARFNGPVGLALDAHDNLFVADSNNHTIRKITPAGVVTTWAGNPGVDGCVDGDALAARFCKPAELAFDRKGNLFVADSFNHVIRKISRAGYVSTVTGSAGNAGAADGVNGQARLFNPYGLAVKPDGSLALADAYNETIRVVLVPFGAAIQVSSAGNATALSWDSVIGRKYQVQFAGAPGTGPWFNVGIPITATSLTMTMTNSSIEANQRIYQVQLLP